MIIVCFGTRPEIIKLSPVLKELQNKCIPFKTVFTGQHRELYEDVYDLLPKEPDFNLKIMVQQQSLNHVVSSAISLLDPILKQEKARLVIVQGDTSTALGAALAAFHSKVYIGHVEAGLRTYNLKSPYPEEGNRQIISRLSDLNWAPTVMAAQNLEKEKARGILLTGDTVIDACQVYKLPIIYGNSVLITLHRRENFGDKIKSMFVQLEELALENPDLKFIFPMHPNEEVQKHKELLRHVKIITPLSYKDLLQVLSVPNLLLVTLAVYRKNALPLTKKF